MRTHLRELLTLRSSWILLLLAFASKILSGVGTFLGEKTGSPISPDLVAGDDMAPFFFGIFAAIAISGYFSHGTMTYDLLANPRRWKMQISRIASLCLLSLATAVVASLANYGLVQILNLAMNRRALQPSFSKLLLSFFLLLMSSLIYCLIGSRIGFLLTTTAASIFAYLGIMWGIPVLSMISGVFSSSLMQKTLTATPAYVTVHLAPSDKWATSLLILFLWGLACQVAGTVRIRRYKA